MLYSLPNPNQLTRKENIVAKSINVKVKTEKIIKALETRLAGLTKQFEADEKATKAYEKEMEAYRKEVAEMAMKNIAKAENVRVSERWNNVLNIDFDLPKGVVKLKQPEAPKRNYWEHQYNEDKEVLENAIRILKLTDEEVVSTSTYNAVARFL